MIVYSQLALATLFNLGTVFFLKKAHGFTVFWPTVWAIVTVSLTQWLISRAMEGGMDMGLAVATVVVNVIIGSAIMGVFLFQENLPTQKIIGFGIAIAGIVIASLAKAPA
ncbi:MAG: SMR family transporter [Alphaproteobacteria bacterium]|nr:SMR family transporter [Alphaproteobacteria bacterium]